MGNVQIENLRTALREYADPGNWYWSVDELAWCWNHEQSAGFKGADYAYGDPAPEFVKAGPGGIAHLAIQKEDEMDDAMALEKKVEALREALEEAEDALRTCYNVCDYPADGESKQDLALRSAKAALLLAGEGGAK